MYDSIQIRALGHIITSSNQMFSTVNAFQVQFIKRQRFATRCRNLTQLKIQFAFHKK